MCDDDTDTAACTGYGSFNGTPNIARGTSIIKFIYKRREFYYERDDHTEGDIIIPDIPGGVVEPTAAFSKYYRCTADTMFYDE